MTKKISFLNIDSKAKINIFLIIIIILIYKTNSQQNFKAVYIGNNYYYLIFTDSINYYKIGNNKIIYTLKSNQKIQSEGDLNCIDFGEFITDLTKDNILIIKNYAYYVFNGEISDNEKLSELGNYPSELVALNCDNLACYFIVGIINQKKIYLYLYKNLLQFHLPVPTMH